MLVSLGETPGVGSTLNTFALDLSATPTWSQMATSNIYTSRGYTQAMWDAAHDRMLMFGGNSFGENHNDIQSLSFPPSFPLTVTASPTAGGVIGQDPSGTCLPANSQVTLYPSPNQYYAFTGWSGDVSGNANPLTITMDAAKNIVANFATYTLATAASPAAGGSVALSPDQPSYPPGSQVSLTANPASGYGFTSWSGDATGTTNPLPVTMDANKTITANFTTYAMTTQALPAGAGAVARSPNLPSYPPGTQVTLTATGQNGFAFLNWSGDASGTTNPLIVTMDGAKNITANFNGYSVTITIAPTGSGLVTKNPNQAVYQPGTQLTLTAGGGFPFTGWSGDLVSSTNPVTITVDANKNITASFQAYSLTTNVVPAGSGSVSRSPNVTLYPPGQITLTAGPTNGYSFTSWTGDASGSTNPLSLVMDADKSVTANFSTPPPACGAWTLASNAALNRAGPAVAWDPVNSRVLRFGGYDGSVFLNDLWSFTLASGWTQLSPAGGPPSARDAAALLYDPVRNRMLLIGGNNSPPPNDVWALSLTGTPTWSLLTTSGTPPAGRFLFSAIYDPVRDRVLRFGGYPINSELWELSLSGTPTWTLLSPAGTPPTGRYGHAAIYDPVRDRMLIQGGNNNSGTIYSDTWALSLSGTPTWSQLSPFGDAPAVYAASAAYDPIRDRMLLVSGTNPNASVNTDAVWSLSMKSQPGWVRLPTGGTALSSRYLCGVAYEPDQDLLLAMNGIAPSGSYQIDVKRLDCAGGWWLETAGDHGTISESPTKACYGNGETVSLLPTGQANYAFQGWLGDASGNTQPLDITMDGNKAIFAQFYTGPVGVDGTPLSFAIEDIHPNPNPGPVEISYSLPVAARVRLTIYDVSGRQMSVLASGVVEPGRHTARWSGRGNGSAAKAGIYFVRYETPVRTWNKRLVLLP
jgi:uncharacterized repeat protein (TIGR02543 family)